MPFTQRKSRALFGGFAAFAIAVVTLTGCSSSKTPKSQETTKSTKSTKIVVEEVKADIESLIANLEAKEYDKFSQSFPSEELLKKFPGGKKNSRWLTSDADAQFYLTLLRSFQNAKPEMNAEQTRATFESTESPRNPVADLDRQAAGKTVTLKGYGADLSIVLDKAIAALEAGRYGEFVDHMFPETELKYLQVKGERSFLLKQIQATANYTRKNMINDLRKLKKLTPKLEDSGNTAVFQVASGIPGRRPGPSFTVKLQKVKGSWRLI